jgi:acarbose 7IV-phosphotransferase
MPRARVLTVVGAFGIDTNVYPLGSRHGAEMTFARTTDAPGQAGCYSAFAAAALGVETRAIAALGDDRAGAWVREALAEAGISLWTLRDPDGTHRSVNIVAADGSRSNFFDPRGVAETVVDRAACRDALAGAGVAHVHLDDWSRQVLPLARDAGAVISCDLQDVVDIDDPYRAEFVAEADVLFMSAANLDEPAAAAAELARRRPGRIVVVGAGADGCLVALDGGVDHFAAIDLPTAPIVDTNGAGDTLAVGFLVAHLLDGVPIEQAVRRAQLGARWICAQAGDQKRPLTLEQLDSLARQAV